MPTRGRIAIATRFTPPTENLAANNSKNNFAGRTETVTRGQAGAVTKESNDTFRRNRVFRFLLVINPTTMNATATSSAARSDRRPPRLSNNSGTNSKNQPPPFPSDRNPKRSFASGVGGTISTLHDDPSSITASAASTSNLLALLKQQMVVIEQLTSTVDQYRIETETAQLKVESMKEDLEKSQAETAEYREAIQQAEYVASEAKSHAESAIQIAKDAEVQTKQVRVDLLVAQRQAENHRKDAESFREQTDHAQKLAGHQREEIRGLASKLKKLTKALEELNRQKEDLSRQNRAKDAELEKLRKSTKECQDRVQVMTQQLASCQKQAEAATKDAAEAQRFAQRVAREASQKVIASSSVAHLRPHSESGSEMKVEEGGRKGPSTANAIMTDAETEVLQEQIQRLRKERDKARKEAQEFKREALALVKKKARDSVIVEKTHQQPTSQVPRQLKSATRERTHPKPSQAPRHLDQYARAESDLREGGEQQRDQANYVSETSDPLVEALARQSQRQQQRLRERDDRSSSKPDADGHSSRAGSATNPASIPTPRPRESIAVEHLYQRSPGTGTGQDEPMEALVSQYKSLKKRIDQKIWQSIRAVEPPPSHTLPPPSHKAQQWHPPSSQLQPPSLQQREQNRPSPPTANAFPSSPPTALQQRASSQPPPTPLLEYRLSRFAAVNKTWGINNE